MIIIKNNINNYEFIQSSLLTIILYFTLLYNTLLSITQMTVTSLRCLITKSCSFHCTT